MLSPAYPIVASVAQEEIIKYIESFPGKFSEEDFFSLRDEVAKKVSLVVNNALLSARDQREDGQLVIPLGLSPTKERKKLNELVEKNFYRFFKVAPQIFASHVYVSSKDVVSGKDQRNYSLEIAIRPERFQVSVHESLEFLHLVFSPEKKVALKRFTTLQPYLDLLPLEKPPPVEPPDQSSTLYRLFSQKDKESRCFLVGGQAVFAHVSFLMASEMASYLETKTLPFVIEVEEFSKEALEDLLKLIYLENVHHLLNKPLKELLKRMVLANELGAQKALISILALAEKKILEEEQEFQSIFEALEVRSFKEPIGKLISRSLLHKLNVYRGEPKNLIWLLRIAERICQSTLTQGLILYALQNRSFVPYFKGFLRDRFFIQVKEISEKLKFQKVDKWLFEAALKDPILSELMQERKESTKEELSSLFDESEKERLSTIYKRQIREQLRPYVIVSLREELAESVTGDLERKIFQKEGGRMLDQLKRELYETFRKELEDECRALANEDFERKRRSSLSSKQQSPSIEDFVQITSKNADLASSPPEGWAQLLSKAYDQLTTSDINDS